MTEVNIKVGIDLSSKFGIRISRTPPHGSATESSGSMQKYSPHDRENKLLAAILKDLRMSAGMHQTDLAAAARLRQSDVSKIETGVRQISYLELRRWLAATHFDMGSFDMEFDARLERMGLTRSLTGP